MEFIEAIEALEASLSWSLAPSTDPEEKVRVFCVPPEWSGYFYNRVSAIARVRVRVLPRRYNPDASTEYGFCHLAIESIDDSRIGIAGPDEPSPQARQRAETLISRLSGRYIPSLDELKLIAADCGCEVDRW